MAFNLFDLGATLSAMSDLPANQPFVCDHCHIVFGSRKALDLHMAEPHRSWQLTEFDRRLCKAYNIKIEDS